MQVDKSGILVGVFAGGALAVSSAPAQAILVYSGLQNISLTRPQVPGSDNLQNVELYTGQFMDFGWQQDATDLQVVITGSSKNGFSFDLGSPYSIGDLPNYNVGQVDSTTLQSCTIADLTNCGTIWGAGNLFQAYRYFDGVSDFYGWARISVPDDFSDPNAATTLLDWAYQTDPNAQVVMGEGLPAEEVPAPLPLMGAAAAFAASRRLRSRIQRQSKP